MMLNRPLAVLLCSAAMLAAQTPVNPKKVSALELAKLISAKSPQIEQSLVDSLGAEPLGRGAVSNHGSTAVFAIRNAGQSSVMLNGSTNVPLTKAGADLWYGTTQLPAGSSHRYTFFVDGKPLGVTRDVPHYTADSYLKPGVKSGTLSERIEHTSKIFDGMTSNYWTYAPAQYNPSTPAAVMVWQDGQGIINRDSETNRILDAIDNLTHEKKIPVIVYIFTSPGRMGETSVRSIEYDTVTDRYARYLRDELIPEVAAKYNLRKDGYSRAIAGHSSGAIAAFNAAWQQTDQFSRVISWNGTFNAIQADAAWGGHAFPVMVRTGKEKKNIRVWLQGSIEDNENRFGSWPLQNIALANALKSRDYDFHLSFGTGGHNMAQGSAEFPATFTWLWRGYDPNKTEEIYVIEPVEKDKPLFRVNIINRDHGPAN